MEKKSRHFSKRLRKYSNPETAQRMAYRYLGKTAKIYPSSNREKKYDTSPKLFDSQWKNAWRLETQSIFCKQSFTKNFMVNKI